MVFMHTPNWKRSSLRIRVYGKIGRKMQNSPVFKLMQKSFCREISIFNSTRAAPAADKNDLFIHTIDELQPAAELYNLEEEAINDGKCCWKLFLTSLNTSRQNQVKLSLFKPDNKP
jgi:hypothetical protein